ncbi:MAG TPA: peptidoglycan DD-metalloendopeptidase family protein [Methylotenera sp.]|nr:peptidoglycan DD-metalloendopeptidase family protein [Methylotenera sp.]HPV45415.1 peptidoglycan DD-metalloendopeptidase family protein [Methylotenera sp.]
MRFTAILLILFLTACETNPPAPVIERAPQTPKEKPTEAKATDTKIATANGGKDWRPDSHIVKKGDTLFGIGLEYGLDYKEIATANHIEPPYPIKIGQKIDLSSFKTKPAAVIEEASTTEDGVVITPMKTEPVIGDKTVVETKAAPSAVTPVLTEPKAVREPYSLEALNRATPPPAAKPVETKPAEAKPADTKPADTKPDIASPADDESITWAWPTQGKVVAGFNEASNKGIDIGGATGQAILAASSGKVIYTGSDLRGYGKLVIVKHNKTYLSVYAHNSKIVAKEGQIVTAGQKIAEMGNTDSSTVKLHFEIRRLGKSVDPAKYLNQN